LQSLDINLDIYINDRNIVQRMAQLTQKTNQFNLTTKRYSEVEINNFLSSKNHLLVAINVKDKFGDSGITALSIINFSGSTAEIDTFLMSCRIIGRNIEFKFFDLIIEQIRKKGISQIKASYFKTVKNRQAEYFYENMGLSLTGQNDNSKHYLLETNKYITNTIDYIRIN
jgi:FkbH-like protein